ncbi:18717_t:CDS:2 [Racocetra fulgida]|uniref:18717_t:CDS:1 n=1 Tax=Racocetra fulgida TaxID=60492 RepID=A0A9N9AUG7_9GLOM|nr:18717_t:CDS:2 [Racocetra fulgida]
MVSTKALNTNKSELCKETQSITTQVYSITESKELIHNNAVVQKNSFEKIKRLKMDLSKLEKMITIITNLQHYNNLRFQIIEVKKNIAKEEKQQLNELKRHATSQ